MAGLTIAIRKNRIGEVSEKLRRESRQEQIDTANRIRDRARSTVHVITGKTRDSIRVDAARAAGTKPDGFRSIAVTAAFGAVFEEYGTRYRPPHPFLRPALESERAPYRSAFSQLLRSL
jgi:HK97 gp10 family phage protein